MKSLFGTDGLRGHVNEFPMQPEVVLRLGLAAGQHFRNGRSRHRVVIGKDTRISGYIFESALMAGFCASGMDVLLVGPLPTPAISFLTRNMRADLGVVISASHNPYMDNGIKFFTRQGFKLSDDVQHIMTRMVTDPSTTWSYPDSDLVGKARRIVDGPGRYIVYLKNSFPQDLSLEGVHVVLDCANGATYRVAPLIFEELGATVTATGVTPNGTNINDKCGSLHPETLSRMVLENNADVGFALDGDGDRLIVVDEKGTVLDGDQIMALCADDLLRRDELPGRSLVATVMSNMALDLFMQERGGKLVRTPVGDRHVVEAMENMGAAFGGEQSGHLIFRRYSTTGDGILAALQVLRIMVQKQQPLSDLSGLLELLPQKLVNVRVARKESFESIPAIARALTEAQAKLASRGRIVLRYSGTEPLARIMVEAEDTFLVEEMVERFRHLLEKNLC